MKTDQTIADLELKRSDRFADAFLIEPNAHYEPSPAELACIDSIHSVMQVLGSDNPTSTELKEELDIIRSQCTKQLTKIAHELCLHPRDGRDKLAVELRDEILRIHGIYSDRRTRALAIPFVIETCPVKLGEERPIKDIIIRTRDVTIPVEKQEFKVELDKTIAVVKAVLLTKRWHRLENIFRNWRRSRSHEADSDGQSSAQSRLDEYLYALSGIARVGLMNSDRSQISLAQLALIGFKDEFVSREAGPVKNSYVRNLGINAGLAVLLSLLGYWVAHWKELAFLNELRNFFLLWAGAAIGTWLSFSIRRVVLGFADLAKLEEDRLNPGLRVIFMLALTTVIGLLFWTGMVSITLGSFTSDFHATDQGERALLIGALCGIAERSLASAVSRRAEDFSAGLGRIGEAAPAATR